MDIELKVAQAKLAYNEAYDAERQFKLQLNMWIDEAEKRVRDEHQPHLDNLRQTKNDLQAALIALQDEQAVTKPHEFEGKRMTRMAWETAYVRARQQYPIYGIFETVTSKSVFAQNTPSWRKPAVGSHIVRLVLKTGLPGVKYEMFNERSDWKPVS